MKINLRHNTSKYINKIISIITTAVGSKITKNDIVLITGVFDYDDAGRYFIGNYDETYLMDSLVAFDNIEEAYAYYQYLIAEAEGGSNGN